ncbi:IclR family transcriptional regulator [Lentilactobacillus curieae]|uniref:IclR family transcriptional regulator n=1 Tax=Lentilactobacillus curieae TaxID=1138822 RepID=A0A1S6QH54_9LACO|nr:IclR family transcriptional regulator [Lentilactobacillus curieae]AQW20934.1 IclR family transcriptional regulator [Lentilactobacillus curieae]
MEKKMYGTVLIKASDILDALDDGKPKSIQTISQETGIGAPTVSKILSTLEYLYYVSKNSNDKTYSLGSKFMKFGSIETTTTDFVEKTRPYLEELQGNIDEAIHLAVPQNDKMIYVNKLEPKKQSIYMTSKIGLTREMYSSGIGKAVLSQYSPKMLDNYLSKINLTPKTPNTITSKEELKQDLLETRKRGYAIDNEEQEKDGYCIAVPISRFDQVVGSLSISIPKFRLTEEYRDQIIANIKKTQHKIESELNK